MIAITHPAQSAVRTAYDAVSNDPTFDHVLSAVEPGDDQWAADVIVADVQERARRGLPVSLDRYLRGVNGLRSRIVPLDAAIDAVLSAAEPDRIGVSSAAVDRLVSSHPDLEREIRDCALLTGALCSTMEVEAILAGDRTLPCDFGPATHDGRQRYALLRQIGRGSSAAVYLAEDRLLSDGSHTAQVAVKVLSACDPALAAVLAEEAAKARRIDHPNVVRVLDRGLTESSEPYLVFELIDDGDLESRFAQRLPLPPREAAAVVRDVARGVHAAHQAGLIHSDLKPQNILMTVDGAPKVADFGIARRTNESGPVSPSGGRMGSLAFMAPEQFNTPEEAISTPADLYALGGLLFWLLTGLFPNGQTRWETEKRLAGEPGAAPIDQTLRTARAPRDLRLICEKALDPAPHQRHASAASLAEDLDAYLSGNPIAWTKPGVIRTAAMWAKRRPLSVLAGAGLVAVVLGAGLLLSYWVQVDAQAKHQSAAVERVLKLRDMMNRVDRRRFEAEVLSYLWLLDWLNKESPLIDPEVWSATARADRITEIQRMIRLFEESGLQDDVECHLWRLAAGLWMLVDNEIHEETAAYLNRAEHDLRRKLGDSDSLVRQAQSLALCEPVKRIYFDVRYNQAPLRAYRSELNAHARSLERERAWLAENRPGSAPHVMVLRALSHIYGQHLLNIKAKHADVEAERNLYKVTE